MNKQQFRFFQSQLFKIAFLLSLLVILFLLVSFIFLTPENNVLANQVQKINTFFSWPYNMLENVTHISMPWFLTALCILMFWLMVFYFIALLLTCLKSD